jgi:Ca-activated chloride channel family protein
MFQKLTAFALTSVLLLSGSVIADSATRMALDVLPVNGSLTAGEKHTTWVRVGVRGFERPREERRSPINVCIVLDRSGSMQGDKIKRAREAAIDAVRMLDPQDIVSVVAYDTVVEVLVPATRLSDPELVIAAINKIQARGNTALFSGVSKGAAEVRKFFSEEYVNRVILLSDGLANTGPSSPGELGALGASLMKESITVSTLGLGLGYNEDLMVQLAAKSGGNHHFIEEASELADVFRREFNDVLSVVAQNVDLRVTVPEGIRPVRVLGNSADINGQVIVTRLSQVYGGQNRFVILELELSPGEPADQRDLAVVDVAYDNMVTNVKDQLAGKAAVQYCETKQEMDASLNRDVMADVVALISSEENKLATQLLDVGDILGCRDVLKRNSAWLEENAVQLKSAKLRALSATNRLQLEQLQDVDTPADARANSARKAMRAYQIGVDNQQKVIPPPVKTPPGKTPPAGGADKSGGK